MHEIRLHLYPRFVDPTALTRCSEAMTRQPQAAAFDVFDMKDGRTFERHVSPRYANGCCEGVVVMRRAVTDNRCALAAQLAQQIANRANCANRGSKPAR